MSEQNILLRIGIDENQIAKSQQAIIDARKEIDNLKNANKLLADEGKKNTAEFVNNESAIRENTVAVRENQRVLDANLKLQSKNTGSIKEMRANISRLKNEYVNLSAEERDNTDAGKELQSQLKSQTDTLRNLEKEIGITSTSVGNYKDEIKAALAESGLFSKAQGIFATAQKTVTTVTNVATASTKSFGAALMATGIGAIVIALGSLISFLMNTQEGMDLVSKATKSVGTFVSVVTDAFAKLGKQIFENIIPTFTSLGDIIGGIITLDFDQVQRGIDGVQKSVGNIDGINVLELGKNAGQAAIEASKLEGEMRNLVRAEKQLELERSNSRATIQELKLLAEDTTKTNIEREAAAKKALDLEQALLSKTIDLAKQKVSIIERENELAENKDADNNRLIDAQIELNNLTEESTGKQIELNNKLNAIRKQGLTDQGSSADGKLVSVKDTSVEDAANIQKEINDVFLDGVKQRGIDTQKQLQDNVTALKSQFAQGAIDLDTFNNELLNLEAAALVIRENALGELLELNRSNAEIDAETRLQIETDLQNQIRALSLETVDVQVAERKKLIDFQVKESAANEAKKISDLKNIEEIRDAKIRAAMASLEAIKTIFGQESQAGKLAAIAQASIDTYVGATAALKFPPPFGQILAAATIVQGLANVAKIKNTAVPKFAEGGGIEVSGPSHAGGGVDVALGGRTVANVEGGEGLFVMKKNAFQSLKGLSDYNQKFGGRSWMKGSSTMLADGGAISRASVPTINRQTLMDTNDNLSSAIGQMTIVTKISDIDRVQNEVRTVSIQGDLR